MTGDEQGASDRPAGGLRVPDETAESEDGGLPGPPRGTAIGDPPAPADMGQAGPDAAGPDAAGPDAAGPDETGPAGEDAADAATDGRHRRPFLRELPVLVVVVLAIALLVKTFVVQPYYIPSSSMEATLMVHDKVLVNKLVYHFRSIQPGDIVVFNGAGSWDRAPRAGKPSSDPFVRGYDVTLRPVLHSIAGLFGAASGQTDFIKRVIGVPGDRVACCNAQGLVTVNGVPLHERSYLYPGDRPSDAPGNSGLFSITVPPGRLWVMGDNRLVSDDSRLRRSDPGSGTIPENEVIGRAFMIVWPPSRWRILPIPKTFSQPGISARSAAEAGSGTVRLQPAAPYLPLAAGVIGVIPLAWLRRRLRRRRRDRPRADDDGPR